MPSVTFNDFFEETLVWLSPLHTSPSRQHAMSPTRIALTATMMLYLGGLPTPNVDDDMLLFIFLFSPRRCLSQSYKSIDYRTSPHYHYGHTTTDFAHALRPLIRLAARIYERIMPYFPESQEATLFQRARVLACLRRLA